MNAAMKRLVGFEWLLADAGLAKVVPDELVGVQLGCVAGKKVQLESASLTLHKGSNEFGSMGRVAIDHEKGRTSPSFEECGEEGGKAGGIEHAGESVEPERSPGCHGRDSTDLLALSAGSNHGGLSAQSPRAGQRYIRADARLIEKEDVGAHRTGSGFEPRELFPFPALDRFGIPLIGAPEWLLRRDVELAEQLADRRHSEPDSEPLFNQVGDDPPSPQTEIEPVLPRILAHDPTADLQLLTRAHLRGTAAGLSRAECPLPTTRFTKPLVDGCPAQAVRLDHFARLLAIPDTAHRHQADCFAALVRERSAVDS